MAVSQNISPTLGVNLDQVYTATEKLPITLGTVTRAKNGRMYIFVQASGTIANDTAVVLTEPAMTVAAGAGAYTTRSGALTVGQRAWVESNAI
jgi:hypothetical protein